MLGKHSTNTATLLLELFKFSISLTRVLEIHLPTPPSAGIEGMGRNRPAPRHSFKSENSSGGWWIYSIIIRGFSWCKASIVTSTHLFSDLFSGHLVHCFC